MLIPVISGALLQFTCSGFTEGLAVLVVSVQGGLGNQMFQYAFGRGASSRLQRRLVFDLTLMPTGKPPNMRRFGLWDLPIGRTIRVFGAQGLRSRPTAPRPLVRHLGDVGRRPFARFVVREPSDDQRLAEDAIPRPIALMKGYWQSPSYFEHIASEIRKELTPSVERESPAHRILTGLGSRAALVVHVRRGDYVGQNGKSTVHGVQDAAYFASAATRLLELVNDDLIALVISDDPGWAEAQLKLPVEVRHLERAKALSAREALSIMCRSQHHIIANSSFSWWGAWLASHDGQQVFYPQRWFADRSVDPEFRFPPHWHSVKV